MEINEALLETFAKAFPDRHIVIQKEGVLYDHYPIGHPERYKFTYKLYASDTKLGAGGSWSDDYPTLEALSWLLLPSENLMIA